MKITEIKTAVVHVKMNGKPHYLYHYVRVYTDEHDPFCSSARS